MAFDAHEVIRQLKINGVKIDPSIEAELIQHLSNPELVEKIKIGSRQWKFPEHHVAVGSAIDFLAGKGFDPSFITALHIANAREMEKMHKAGSLRSRAAIALKAAAKKRFVSRRAA